MKDKDALASQINNLLNTQSAALERARDLEKETSELRYALAERDEYILNLKKVVVDFRETQPLYIPAKNDNTDIALADYINSQPDPSLLKLLFLRESEGIYQFGSKKIYVKNEGGRIYIRVGGGFLSIQEFLEQNAPIELEKFNRNDPVRIVTNNLAVSKAIAGRCVREIEKPRTSAYQVKELSPKIRKN